MPKAKIKKSKLNDGIVRENLRVSAGRGISLRVAEVMRAANEKSKSQRTKPPLRWMDAEALIEAEIERVKASPEYTVREQAPGYTRALLLLRRHRRVR